MMSSKSEVADGSRRDKFSGPKLRIAVGGRILSIPERDKSTTYWSRGLDWEELLGMRAASMVINGYVQVLSETGEITESDMNELSLSEDKAFEAVENVDSAGNKGYDLVAETLLAEENLSGLQIYDDVFEGDFISLPHFATR